MEGGGRSRGTRQQSVSSCSHTTGDGGWGWRQVPRGHSQVDLTGERDVGKQGEREEG